MAVSPEVLERPFVPSEATKTALELRGHMINLDSYKDPKSAGYKKTKKELDAARARFAEQTWPFVQRTAQHVADNYDQAQEIVQITYEKALAKVRSFEGKSQVETWLFRVVHNTFKDYRDKIARRRDTEPLDEEMLGIAEFDNFGGPLESLERIETRNELMVILKELTPNQRLSVLGHYVLGMSHKEIAEAVGQSVNGAKILAFRGLRRAKEKMQEENA